MRKKICLFLFLCFLGSICCIAQTGNLSKNGLKNYKKTCKQLKKEGWKVYDKALSLDDAMMKYYLQLEAGADSVVEFVVEGQAKNANKAYLQAKHRATFGQAAKKSLYVKGKTSVKESSDKSGEMTKIHHSNVAETEQSIKSLSPALSLYRTLKDGTTEINLYYITKY